MQLLHKNKYRALHDWFATPQGVAAGCAIAREIVKHTKSLSGFTLAQLGMCGTNPWLAHMSFARQWVLSPCVEQKGRAMVCAFNALPFERNSLDCVIVPFGMEVFGLQTNLLDEVDRVLRPMGHAVFIGINPWSLWGAGMRFGKAVFMGQAHTHLTSSILLHNALLHRGLQQTAFSSFYYTPPVRSMRWIKRFDVLNEMGKMVWPLPPAFYCLIAQKYQCITPSLRPQVMRAPVSTLPLATGV